MYNQLSRGQNLHMSHKSHNAKSVILEMHIYHVYIYIHIYVYVYVYAYTNSTLNRVCAKSKGSGKKDKRERATE